MDREKQLRRESLWWHSYWRACGQPHEGEVAEKHRITRAQYHRAVKNLKNENDKMKMERMAEAVASSNMRNLWNEANKIKGRNNHKASDIDDISNIFHHKYEHLYSSVPSDVADMQGVYELIGKILADSDGLFNICVNDVVQSVNRLKSGKSDESGLYSDHVRNGPHNDIVCITYLFIQCYVGTWVLP